MRYRPVDKSNLERQAWVNRIRSATGRIAALQRRMSHDPCPNDFKMLMETHVLDLSRAKSILYNIDHPIRPLEEKLQVKLRNLTRSLRRMGMNCDVEGLRKAADYYEKVRDTLISIYLDDQKPKAKK